MRDYITKDAWNIIEEGFDPTNGKPIEVIIEAKKDVEIMYAKGNSKAFSKERRSSLKRFQSQARSLLDFSFPFQISISK